ncbi:hypothetical protein [Saccharolobus islandicus]|uniref:hypothetical protein n=1 Tax=Saccharolobus islandicus TaxID=43080 RepID=UPI000AC4EF2D|nr:hypothetical protein [Sulfolobus islandicus]
MRFKVNINFLVTSAGIEIRGGRRRVVNSLIETPISFVTTFMNDVFQSLFDH